MNNVKIVLFNSIGEMVKEIYAGHITSNQKITTSISNLPTGIYTMQCTNTENTLKSSFAISK